MVFVDPDGCDILLIIWASYNGRVGHAGLAVSNYTKEGKPTGTYTYYDKWPNAGVTKNNVTASVPALYNKKVVGFNDLLYKDVTKLEGRPPNGVIRIKTDSAKDKKAIEAMEEVHMPYYNGAYANCADYAKSGITAATGLDGGKEMVGNVAVTTPNALYNFIAKVPGATIEYDANDTVKHNLLDAIGNDPIKSIVTQEKAPSGE